MLAVGAATTDSLTVSSYSVALAERAMDVVDRECQPDLRQDCAGVLVAEVDRPAGAVVLGVDVDVVAEQRVAVDRRASQVDLVVDAGAAGA